MLWLTPSAVTGRHAHLVIIAALAALAPQAASAAGASLATGAYDNTLMLGFDPATSVVTGYFDMAQPGPPTISCAFAIKGKLIDASADVDTAYPGIAGDLIEGTLTVSHATAVRVALPTDHGGCANVWTFADKTNPADFTLQTALPWIGVRVAKSAKVYFYPKPGAAVHGRDYVVASDGLGVRSVEGDWVEADYTGGRTIVSGWVKAVDLFPAP